jgi:tryptophan synthase alpha chain
MDLTCRLEQLIEQGEGAHMPHVYYGDPNQDFSEKLITTLTRNGADLIEFGIPFSDPTADGPLFIAACERALNNDVTPEKCLDAIQRLRLSGLKIPIVVTSYYNILYVAGVRNFLKQVKKAGAQAIIVPNLPIEEAGILLDEAAKLGIYPILQVTPTTTGDRLRKICEASSGFIYVVNVEGVTGVRDSLYGSTLKLVKRVRNLTSMPILAGFGISRPEHAKAVVKAGADGVIAGSIYTRIYEKHLEEPGKALPEIKRLIKQIKQACKDGVTERA